jgi:N-acetylmuramic acid 6-phosphate (MurNAc-6-P) etherase
MFLGFSMTTLSRLKLFWNDYYLHKLPDSSIENFNKNTFGLAELAQNNLESAISILVSIDTDLLGVLLKYSDELKLLQEDISRTFSNNGRVIICGDESIGKQIQLLERLWIDSVGSSLKHKIIILVPGGDLSLITSSEYTESDQGYIQSYLDDIEFEPKDLLIAVAECGRSQFVLDTLEIVINRSMYPPYFLCCLDNISFNCCQRA